MLHHAYSLIVALGLTVVVAIFPASARAGGIILHVDGTAPAGGDGLSWKTAHRFLKDALNDAIFPVGSVSEIRVAQGVYHPDRDAANPLGSGNRFANFHPIAGAEIRGGYAGLGAPNPDLRDIALFETILSGDLNGDDGPAFANNGENSQHVVFVSQQSATRSYDGFTITGGNINTGSPAGQVGGGVWIGNAANFTLRNCRVTGNRAVTEGGGVWIFGGGNHLKIENCVIENNECDGVGGGLYIENSSSIVPPSFNDCLIRNNTAVLGPVAYGGGAYIALSSTPTFTNCSFEGNRADVVGGGCYITEQAFPTFTDCQFRLNTASSTGALHVTSGSHPEVTGCTFTDNVGTFGVGGINISSDSAATVVNCRFFGNEGTSGAIQNRGSAVITGSVFSGNQAATNGGAILCFGTPGSTALRNCSFAGNIAGNEGGGVFIFNFTHNISITNCAFWDNQDGGGILERAQLRAFSNFALSIDHSFLQGWSGTFGGVGNSGIDPLFVNPDGMDGIPGTEDDDLHLQSASPAIDAGDPLFVPQAGETDIDGDPRVLGLHVDIGADEFVPAQPCPGDITPFGGGNGVVNIDDLVAVLNAFGSCPGCPEDITPAGGNGVVNIDDLVAVLNAFGACP